MPSRSNEALEHEASFGFDAADVEPCLIRISGLVSGSFAVAEARALAQRINKQPHDSEREYTFSVLHASRSVRLRIVAFMDDIDAPDIAFFTVPALDAAIQREIESYFHSVGK